nr:flagellar basal body protein [Nocardioides ginsengisegetis]
MSTDRSTPPKDRHRPRRFSEAGVSFAFPDAVGAVLNSALDGIALRQRVIADNIANVDTPGYRATSVDFETSLRAAISSGDLNAAVVPTETPTDTPVGANGNNVDLRKETLAAVQSQFQYQVLTRATSDRFDLIKTVAGGQ